jgi:aldehyde oxidoreductase
MIERMALSVNGRDVTFESEPAARLSDVLRLQLGLTGTKVGCEAGDCGACTILLDNAQVCACMISAAQVSGRRVETVEGLADDPAMRGLQDSFHRHGAAQCGICTPGMLIAAAELLRAWPQPDEQQVKDALGGVLCRCTGYRKIIDAVMDAGGSASPEQPPAGRAVGSRMAKVDGRAKLTGAEIYAADRAPADALWLRAVRSLHTRAKFHIGDMAPLHIKFPGLVRVVTAADVPGHNGFGIYPHIKDQPALADGIARFKGEAVAALVGDEASIRAIHDEDLPIEWEALAPVTGVDGGLADGAPVVQSDKPDNILARGNLLKGNPDHAFEQAAHVVEARMETGFVEHAYIEPEAGWARRGLKCS